MASCFFLGHREAPDSIRGSVYDAVERLITEYGVKEFYAGNYGHFDRMAQGALRRAKSRHPDITLRLLVPYHPGERAVTVPKGFDGTFYPPGMETVPRRFAIARANRTMLSCCDYLITYVWHPASSAREQLAFAARRGIHIENLAENDTPG